MKPSSTARELSGDCSTQQQFRSQLRAIAAGIALLTAGYGRPVRDGTLRPPVNQAVFRPR